MVSRQTQRRGIASQAVATAIAIVAAATITHEARRAPAAIRAINRSANVTASRVDFDYFRCVEQHVRRLIPRGARVKVEPADPNTLEYQRLTEALTPGYRVVGAGAAPAPWHVRLAPAASQPADCGSNVVQVEAP